jgi:hypothetical protein
MERLLKIGFAKAGYWHNDERKPKCVLEVHRKAERVLYAFLADGVVMYIGKTIMTLERRMYGYQNPGPTQSTNIRINTKIYSALATGKAMDIFVLPDSGFLKYGDFAINLAAGLEDELISVISPEWNMSGKKKIAVDIQSEKPLTIADTASLPNLDTTSFEITLGEAYYNQGFFNVKKEYADLFGADKALIEIQMCNTSEAVIQGYINRTANTNGTPRIMCGKPFKDWVQASRKPGDTIKITVISPGSIIIE